MAITAYPYTKAVDVSRLEKEIRDSSIVTALDHTVFNSPDDLIVYFKAELSEPDETTLDGIVQNHTNTPLEPEAAQVQVVGQSEVSIIGPVVESGDVRLLSATNRIPAGYTQYLTGRSDDIANDAFGTGSKLKFTKNDKVKYFEQKKHYYIIGARSFVDNEGSLKDEFKASLIAPASTGWTANGTNTGNANRVNLGGGAYIIVPAPGNDGNTNINLAQYRSGSTSVLANTPVPQAGDTGYWNYDAMSNTISVVSDVQNPDGNVNLYTFDITLHRFAEAVYCAPNQMLNFEAADIIGKLIWNTWKMKLEFVPDTGIGLRNPEIGIVLTVGVKGNV